MRLSRRVFLQSGGVALVGFGLDPVLRTHGGGNDDRPSATKGASRRTLVLLYLRGGVDGLSMVVPHGEKHYYALRPKTAIARREVIDLDGRFGLHPALAPLKALWDDKTLAVLPAVGLPRHARSHRAAREDLETGVPGAIALHDGWLNRYHRGNPRNADVPFRAMAFGDRPPRILTGDTPPFMVRELPEHPAESSQRRGSRRLTQLAALITSGVGIETAFIEMGGWDTHVQQGAAEGRLASALGELARGLAAFARALGPRMEDVLVLTLSEFGRTLPENRTGGTDHGLATAMLAVGGPVNGGRVLGAWPELGWADHEGLPATTDVRDVLGEALVTHLGAADLTTIFPGHQAGPAKRLLRC